MTVAVHHVLDGPASGQDGWAGSDDWAGQAAGTAADQPTVVLAGSLGSDVSMWEPQVPALTAAGFAVLRYDHRGHGRSPVPPGPYTIDELGADAVALLDRLGLRRVHWVGLSLGGMVGMWLAQHRPDLVDRLVLCCTSARLGPPQMWADRVAQVREHGMAAFAGSAIGRWLTPAGAAARPELVARLKAMIAAIPVDGYAGCCGVIEHMDLVPGLGRIGAPTLVIAGAQDPATPPEHARRIAAGIPGARLAIVDGAAHLGNVERPTEFTQLILGHVLAATADSATTDSVTTDSATTDSATTDSARADRAGAGMAVRREVLGDAHVDRAVATTTEFTAPFQEYITAAVWGSIWTRDGIDRRTRSAVTLALLTAMRCHEELTMHVHAALRNGLTPAEIAEVLLHTSAYAGVPAARAAFEVAQRAIADHEPGE